MKIFDVYGFQKGIESVRSAIERAVNIKMEAHESSYHCGDYYRYEDPAQGKLILQLNYDEVEDEWTEDQYKEYSTFLYVSESKRSEQIEQLITSKANGVLLRRRTI